MHVWTRRWNGILAPREREAARRWSSHTAPILTALTVGAAPAVGASDIPDWSGPPSVVAAAITGVGRARSSMRAPSSTPPATTPPVTTAPSTAASTAHTVEERVYGPAWSAVHADAFNSDYSPVPGPRQVELAWSRSFDGAIQLGPLEWTINLGPTSDADGHVYVTSSVAGCHFQQLDLETGRTNWCAESVRQSAIGSSALLDAEGTAYLADGEYMRSFDSDGTALWEAPIVGVPFSAQFSPAGNLVFITHLGVVYVLDRHTGESVIAPTELAPHAPWNPDQQVWACARGTEQCPSANTIAVDTTAGPGRGNLYFTWWESGHAEAGLRAIHLDEQRGTISDLWFNESLPGGSASTPTVSADGSRVYVTDNADSIHAIDAASGATIWTHAIGVAPGGSLSLSPDAVMIPAGGPLVAVRDAGPTAVEVWRRDDLINVGIATQAAGGTAYATIAAGGGAAEVVVLDMATGDVLDREPIEGTTRFSVGITVADDGTVLVPMIGGELLAYRAAADEGSGEAP